MNGHRPKGPPLDAAKLVPPTSGTGVTAPGVGQMQRMWSAIESAEKEIAELRRRLCRLENRPDGATTQQGVQVADGRTVVLEAPDEPGMVTLDFSHVKDNGIRCDHCGRVGPIGGEGLLCSPTFGPSACTGRYVRKEQNEIPSREND